MIVFDNIVNKVFINNENTEKIKNNIKVLNLLESKNIIDLVKEPSLIFLIESFTSKINTYLIKEGKIRRYEYYDFIKIQKLLILLNDYFNNQDDMLLNDFIKTVFTGNVHDLNNLGKTQITIVPKDNFEDYLDKKTYFVSLYEKINYFDDKCDCIDGIIFSNRFLFEDFVANGYNVDKSNFEELIITYHDDIKSMEMYLQSSSNKEKNIKSILNFISTNKLIGEKYKIIRRLNINYKNYNEKKYNYSQDASLVERLILLESALYDFNEQYSLDKHLMSYEIYDINSISISYISKIINLIEKDKYITHLLMSEYNKKLINYINKITKLEPIDIEYLDNDIKSLYFDDSKAKWIIKEYNNEL